MKNIVFNLILISICLQLDAKRVAKPFRLLELSAEQSLNRLIRNAVFSFGYTDPEEIERAVAYIHELRRAEETRLLAAITMMEEAHLVVTVHTLLREEGERRNRIQELISQLTLAAGHENEQAAHYILGQWFAQEPELTGLINRIFNPLNPTEAITRFDRDMLMGLIRRMLAARFPRPAAAVTRLVRPTPVRAGAGSR